MLEGRGEICAVMKERERQGGRGKGTAGGTDVDKGQVQDRGARPATQVHDSEGFAGSVVVVGDDHLAGAQHHGDEP